MGPTHRVGVAPTHRVAEVSNRYSHHLVDWEKNQTHATRRQSNSANQNERSTRSTTDRTQPLGTCKATIFPIWIASALPLIGGGHTVWRLLTTSRRLLKSCEAKQYLEEHRSGRKSKIAALFAPLPSLRSSSRSCFTPQDFDE